MQRVAGLPATAERVEAPLAVLEQRQRLAPGRGTPASRRSPSPPTRAPTRRRSRARTARARRCRRRSARGRRATRPDASRRAARGRARGVGSSSIASARWTHAQPSSRCPWENHSHHSAPTSRRRVAAARCSTCQRERRAQVVVLGLQPLQAACSPGPKSRGAGVDRERQVDLGVRLARVLAARRCASSRSRRERPDRARRAAAATRRPAAARPRPSSSPRGSAGSPRRPRRSPRCAAPRRRRTCRGRPRAAAARAARHRRAGGSSSRSPTRSSAGDRGAGDPRWRIRLRSLLAAHHRLDLRGDAVQPARRDVSGRELDRQRQPVERTADARRRRSSVLSLAVVRRQRAGALEQQLHGIGGQPAGAAPARPPSSATSSTCSPSIRSGRRVVATTHTPAACRRAARRRARRTPRAPARSCRARAARRDRTGGARARRSCDSPGSARTPSWWRSAATTLGVRADRDLGELDEPRAVGERLDVARPRAAVPAGSCHSRRRRSASRALPAATICDERRELVARGRRSASAAPAGCAGAAESRRRREAVGSATGGRQLVDPFARPEVEEALLAEVEQLGRRRPSASRAEAETSTWPG